jgi:hypothetical protein
MVFNSLVQGKAAGYPQARPHKSRQPDNGFEANTSLVSLPPESGGDDPAAGLFYFSKLNRFTKTLHFNFSMSRPFRAGGC